MRAVESSRFVTSGLWKWVKGTGLERFELLRQTNGWTIRGTIVALGERGPAEAAYTISCNAAWRTQHADILLRDTSGEHSLHLNVDEGHWFDYEGVWQRITETHED